MRFISARVVLLCALTQLLVVAYASAETVSIAGLSFAVESIQPVDGDLDLVKVKLFGHESLVTKDSIAIHVAREYFTNAEGAQKFTQHEIETFILGASGEERFDLAALALTSLVQRPGVNMQQLRTFLGEFSTNKNSPDVIKQCLTKLSARTENIEIAASMAIDILGRDSLWLREHLATWFFLSLESIRPALIDRYNALVLSGSSVLAQTLLTNWRDLVGDDDPTFRDLSAIDNKVRSLDERLAKHDIIGAGVMVDFNDTRPVMHDLLVPMYIAAAEREAADLIERSQPNAAVAVLLHIDFMRRTPKTHQLLAQALAAPQLELARLLGDDSIRSLLRLYSEKDQALGDIILERAQELFDQQLAQSQLAGAEEAFSLIRELRPDPNRDNGQMRLDLAAGYLQVGDRGRAEQHMEQARAMIALGDYARMFLLILKADWLVLTLLLVLLTGSTAVLYLKALPFFSSTVAAFKTAKAGRPSPNMEDELDEELPRFVQFSGTQGNPDYEEYRRCLAFFQLNPEATLSAIKNSYRSFVKEHHPDAQGGDKSFGAKEEFRKALEIYNRILELRKKFSDRG